MIRVLIIGGNGFVGQALAAYIANEIKECNHSSILSKNSTNTIKDDNVSISDNNRGRGIYESVVVMDTQKSLTPSLKALGQHSLV